MSDSPAVEARRHALASLEDARMEANTRDAIARAAYLTARVYATLAVSLSIEGAVSMAIDIATTTR
jgi:hypothetical protein